MEEVPQTTSQETFARPRRRRTSPLVLLLIAVVITAVIGWGMYFLQVRHPVDANQQMNSQLVQKVVGLADPKKLTLDPKFADADGDLVADAPTDPKQFIDPPTLSFAFIGTEQPERYRDGFKDFLAFLSNKIGKPVEYLLLKNTDEELAALRDGRIHIAGINTGNVPIAVNEDGFVPVAGLGNDQGGSTYQMLIIVPPGSPIKDVKDLKGRELVLTEAGSNSGFKAPLVLLRDAGLLPGRDFQIRYSGKHESSIKGIASKEYQAAAVAGDILNRSIAAGDIRADQYHVIFTSDAFPTAGFGYVYNLKPELAAKLKDAFFSFAWKGTGLEREFGAGGESKFVPVSYKKDFELVRRIDDEIRSFRGADILMPPTEEATTEPTTAPATTTPAVHEQKER